MATLSIGLDLGLRVARWGQIELLQHPANRTDAVRNHAFRLTMAIACGPALLFIVAAWPIGAYFGSPELTIMALLCAPVILLSAAGSTAEAILRNEFRFKHLAYRNSVCTLIGGAVAIAMAVRGFGATALAVQQLVQALLGTIWVWTAVAWRPSFARLSYFRPRVARQGASIMTGSLLPQLIPRSFDLVVAVLLGPVALGIMRVANRFNDFVGQLVSIPLVGVANAQFSTVANNPAAVRQSYLRLTQVSAAVTCPVMIGVGLVAPEAVPLLFGTHWVSSIPIVQIFSLLGIILPATYYFAPAMVALGKRRVVLRQSMLDLGVGVAAAVLAASISLETVAWAIVARYAFTSVCNVFDLRAHLDLRIRDLAHHLAAPYVATLAMTASVMSARQAFGDSYPQVDNLVVLTFSGALAYVATMLLGILLRLWPSDGVDIRRLLPGDPQRLYDDA
jgi:PST family polysaccharide transporter